MDGFKGKILRKTVPAHFPTIQVWVLLSLTCFRCSIYSHLLFALFPCSSWFTSPHLGCLLAAFRHLEAPRWVSSHAIKARCLNNTRLVDNLSSPSRLLAFLCTTVLSLESLKVGEGHRSQLSQLALPFWIHRQEPFSTCQPLQHDVSCA